MRVLITGGAGYIGSFVVRRLQGNGHQVCVLDNLSTGIREAVGEARLDVVDIRDGERVDRVVGGFRPAAIIHLAALKAPAESIRQPELYYDVNVTGTANLLRAANNHSVERFVFSSSCAVYGSPQVCPVDERSPVSPISPYGETKLAGEKMVGWYAAANDMLHASLRYFNVAGAASDASLGEHVNERTSQLVPRAILAALQGGAVEIYGEDFPTSDGTAMRDFIHVEDLAAAHVQVLEQLTRPEVCAVYNFGSGHPVSVRSVVDEIERRSNTKLLRSVRPRRPGDPAASWADPQLAQRVFGWSAVRDLDDIVDSAWSWHTATELHTV